MTDMNENQSEELMDVDDNLYEDRLFTLVFGNEANRVWMLSLYNAIMESDHTDPSQLEFATDGVYLYLGVRNDAALIISTNLLAEHQIAHDPNLSLRFMFHTVDLCVSPFLANEFGFPRGYVPPILLGIHCFHLYRGVQSDPAMSIGKLSDHYEKRGAQETDSDGRLGVLGEELLPECGASIELLVKAVNVSHIDNAELLESCGALDEFVQFTASLRCHIKEELLLGIALDAALDDIPEGTVIGPFLRDNREEVFDLVYRQLIGQEE